MSTAIHRSAAADCPNDEGKKKPQLLEQQPDVMAGTAQNSMKRITQRTFQRISCWSSISLHVSDGWFDCAAPFDHCVKGVMTQRNLHRSCC